jgi:MerR family transcriptional regulator, copper efflux regulator
MQIGAVAQRTGLSVDTIRFYEKQGLMPAPPRTDGGFRRYRETDLERLDFIARAQELGFSLQDIRELLVLDSHAVEDCSHVHEFVIEKLAAVRRKIRDLKRLQRSLERAEEECHRALTESCSCSCPVLDEIAHRPSHKEKS